ncbi:MAG: hypothetical protein C0624_02835, partial [Desulfuromonas sp.]
MSFHVRHKGEKGEGCSLIAGLAARANGSDVSGLSLFNAAYSCGGFFDRLIEELREPVLVLDTSGVLLHTNQAFSDLFRIPVVQLHGRTLDEILIENPLQVQVLADETSDRSRNARRWELIVSHSAGEMREIVIETSPLFDGQGDVQAYLGSVQDVTESRSSQRLVEQLTYSDALTGLANQRRFEERLGQALLLPDLADRGLAVVWLAVEKIPLVRDSHGESAVEQLIRAAADYLATCVRDRDLIAHVGGGRFALMLFAEKSIQELTAAVDRIVHMVSRPVHIAQKEMHISVRTGVSVFPQDGILATELIDGAQTALSRAQTEQGGRIRFYSRDMNLQAAERLELEACLRGALLRKELVLHYQPQVAIESGRVVALEALLRWHSPENGWVAPDRFIPLAESSGMIHAIGNWVLKTALAQLRGWLDSGMTPLRMAINVSAEQLLNPNFIDIVGRSLQENGIAPEQLELELTESSIMRHTEKALKVFRALKKMGVHLAVDDFGTGYSSLAYLKSFPVDRLKIDRSFLEGLA